MKMMQKSLLALAVLATTALNVQAASSVDVKVIGSIDPGTCTPTLTGGGTIDYGVMSPSIVNATGYTVLSEKQLDLNITCTAPSKVGIQVINQRRSTTAGTTEGNGGWAVAPSGVTIFGIGGMGVAGLGLSDGVKVGGYGMRLVPSTLNADAVAVTGTISNDRGSSWSAMSASSTGNLASVNNLNRYVSVTSTGQSAPIAFTNLTGKLGVQAYLNEKSALNLTKVIKLDGLSTLELVYLP